MSPTIKTASWFSQLPDDHQRIGISRGIPRRLPAGYRVLRGLQPGSWFNSVGIEEYYQRYRSEVLAQLDPVAVADTLAAMSNGRIPVLLCYEPPKAGQWCHRAMAAEWLAEALGVTVPEFGFESLPQDQHPLMPPQLRRAIASTIPADVTAFTGRTATIDGELHTVIGPDPDKPGMAIIAARDRRFSTSIATLRQQFSA